MHTPDRSDCDILNRAALALAALTFLVSAALTASLAGGHMASLGQICGAASAPHCGWCLATTALVLAGLGAALAGARPMLRRVSLPVR